jgi:CubicO group peptidase (beta-lactamase class C family)
MLTAALARLGEAPFEHLLEERVLRSLGLGERDVRYLPHDRRRCVATELDSEWRGRRLRGEVHDENAFAMGGVAGHAGLFGTAAAVARLMHVYARGEVVGEAVAAEARREQALGPNARRGLGLALRAPVGPMCSERFSASSFGHSGFTGTTAWYDPEKDLLVVLLTNALYYGRQEHGLYPLRVAVHQAVAEA